MTGRVNSQERGRGREPRKLLLEAAWGFFVARDVVRLEFSCNVFFFVFRLFRVFVSPVLVGLIYRQALRRRTSWISSSSPR